MLGTGLQYSKLYSPGGQETAFLAPAYLSVRHPSEERVHGAKERISMKFEMWQYSCTSVSGDSIPGTLVDPKIHG